MTSQAPLHAAFLLGLPDDRNIKVTDVDAQGNFVYTLNGNSQFYNIINLPNLLKTQLPLIWFKQTPLQLNKPNIIVNCITDPDIAGNSLVQAAQLIAQIKNKWPDVAVFNNPEKIADTSRSRIYELYKDLPGVKIPKAIKIIPSGCDDVIRLAKAEGIEFPFLIRPCGAHQSEGLQLIKSQADAEKLEAYAYDGSKYYVTEFVDYRSDDGLYRKARLLIIGGKILPRHYMTGEDWLVHGNLHEDFMADNEKSKQEEEYFLNNFRSMINPPALDSLLEIYKSSGLDYLGYDFTITADGNILVFEINPAQNSFIQLDSAVFPYMQNTRNNLIAAVNQAILKKCGL